MSHAAEVSEALERTRAPDADAQELARIDSQLGELRRQTVEAAQRLEHMSVDVPVFVIQQTDKRRRRSRAREQIGKGTNSAPPAHGSNGGLLAVLAV